VPGEHIAALRPLPVPGQGAREFSGSAVELFAARAASVIPGFTLTRELLPEVTALCQRLDGIPLAIELAALRLRALPLTEMGRIASQHDGPTRVLTGVRRTSVLRHQSLRKSIEWSRDLCGQAELAAWARLSVFADWFDLASAEAVCADEELPPGQVTRAIIGLTDKSVLLREPPADPAGPGGLAGLAGSAGAAASRYRLPSALREAGADLLADTADGGAAVRGRYIAHWTRAAGQFASHILDDQLGRYQALRREHANLRAALGHALTLPAADPSAARLGSALSMYWVISGDLRQGRDWLDQIVGRHGDPLPERARALAARAFLAAMAGDLPGARADAEASIELAARAGDRAALTRGYVALHRVHCSAGDIAAATATESLALPALERAGDTLGLAQVDIQSGLARVVSDPRACGEICARALRRLPPGELWATSTLLGLMALARLRAGEHEAATEPARDALAMKHQLGDAAGTGHGLGMLGLLAGATGLYERAAVLLGAAGPLRARAGHGCDGDRWMEELHRETVQAAIGALGEARYTSLRDAGAAQPPDQVIALALGSVGEPGLPPAPGTAATPSAATPRTVPRAPATPPGTRPLTSREVEIAMLVADGLSNKEIAQRMVISKRTVDAHVDHIFAKLGLSSRVQLTVWLRDRIPRTAEPAPSQPLRLPVKPLIAGLVRAWQHRASRAARFEGASGPAALDEGARELLGLIAGAVGDFREAVPEGAGIPGDLGLVVVTAAPDEVPGEVEGQPVDLGAQVVLLVVAVEVADAVSSRALNLPGGSRQPMGALDVAGPAALQREADAVADIGQRVLKPRSPGHLLARAEGLRDHLGAGASAGRGPRQPCVGIVEGPRGGDQVKDRLGHRSAGQVPPGLRVGPPVGGPVDDDAVQFGPPGGSDPHWHGDVDFVAGPRSEPLNLGRGLMAESGMVPGAQDHCPQLRPAGDLAAEGRVDAVVHALPAP
jgi:DNA-binding CsgD family transcriptional regulator